jgi:hypothetical protein
MITRAAFVLVLTWGTLAAGCRPFQAATPAGFVTLADQEPYYDYRATTADGVVLGVRAIDNEPYGDEGFWTQAISNRMRTLGGYALLETRPVTCQTGAAGKQLRFGHDEGSTPHLYHLTVFVTAKRIFLLEAGGPKEMVERDAAKLDAFVAQFRLR